MEVLPKLEAGRMSKYRCVSERVTPFDCSQHIQTPWIFTFKVGRINPTYQTISESDRCGSVGSAAVDPSISDRMYDVVGKEKAGKEVLFGPTPLATLHFLPLVRRDKAHHIQHPLCQSWRYTDPPRSHSRKV